MIKEIFKSITIDCFRNHAIFEFHPEKKAHILNIEKLVEELEEIKEKLEAPKDVSQYDYR
jgi:hypothetical protein